MPASAYARARLTLKTKPLAYTSLRTQSGARLPSCAHVLGGMQARSDREEYNHGDRALQPRYSRVVSSPFTALVLTPRRECALPARLWPSENTDPSPCPCAE
jgi:hypothetical protein